MKSSPSLPHSLVLIGMPGSGKSTIGRKVAARLDLPFTDSDTEIEAAAGMTVPQIFSQLGEPAFRMGERKVIARLLDGERCVLSTGGGAFMEETTRALIKQKGLSLWLKADLSILIERTSRTKDRPLLQGDNPAEILQNLMTKREPVFAQADLTVITGDNPIDVTVDAVVNALERHLSQS
ncbi:MAG: shikimate kinase [Bdellovibrionales bacterium]|jgi:shikimate kinase